MSINKEDLVKKDGKHDRPKDSGEGKEAREGKDGKSGKADAKGGKGEGKHSSGDKPVRVRVQERNFEERQMLKLWLFAAHEAGLSCQGSAVCEKGDC